MKISPHQELLTNILTSHHSLYHVMTCYKQSHPSGKRALWCRLTGWEDGQTQLEGKGWLAIPKLTPYPYKLGSVTFDLLCGWSNFHLQVHLTAAHLWNPLLPEMCRNSAPLCNITLLFFPCLSFPSSGLFLNVLCFRPCLAKLFQFCTFQTSCMGKWLHVLRLPHKCEVECGNVQALSLQHKGGGLLLPSSFSAKAPLWLRAFPQFHFPHL